ncbi:MAG: hypothetical protein R6V10_08255, partial [bacterium]
MPNIRTYEDRDTISPVVSLVPYAVLFLLWLIGWSYYMDDAFITFTYASCLAETGQVSYNGLQVEGYTSFLQMIIAAVFLLALPPSMLMPLMKMFFLIIGFVCLYLSGRILSFLKASPRTVWFGRLAIGLSPVLAYHYTTGLETPLVYLFSLALFYLLAKKEKLPMFQYFHLVAALLFVGMLVR